MKLSCVIITRNRRERLLSTLRRLREDATLAVPGAEVDTWVVDNASTDGTAEVLAREFPDVRQVRNRRNQGMAARNRAFERADADYYLLLDDDSYPIGATVARAVSYLETQPAVAALTGRVELAGGGLEASALPAVLIGCGCLLRAAALREVGPFPEEFLRQAEEYDLSFRLWQAGYRVERFEDLVFRHDKDPTGRPSSTVHRFDLRNNLIVLRRYLPAAARSHYERDWLQRYRAFARQAGHRRASWRGRLESHGWALRDRLARRARPLGEAAFERIFAWRKQSERVGAWARKHGARRVLLADLSKNIYATYRACAEAGIEPVGIVDDHPAFAGLRYRGLAVRSQDDARGQSLDGIILTNVNPARVAAREAELRRTFDCPVLTLWEPKYLGGR